MYRLRRERIDKPRNPSRRPSRHSLNYCVIDTNKHWWPQAETVVGFLNAYQISDQRRFLDGAERSWAFIEKYIIDREHGEWFSMVSQSGVPATEPYKVDSWKCPYHNARTCFEVMKRLDAGKASLTEAVQQARR